jgi:hypothetical protein
MTANFLSIARIERRLTTGGIEQLDFQPGVNLLVGPPNTGKTRWLATLDFLLGDPGTNPFEGAEEEGLADKYSAAAAYLLIGDRQFVIERRWREPGGKGRVYLDGLGLTAKDFQHWLLEALGIPLLNFPKGNPMSGQTWPELSFRTLLRHIYRQQRFWGEIADLQPPADQHASVLQFLGLAEYIFNDDFGQLIDLKRRVEELKARRSQYAATLNDLVRDLLAEEDVTVGVSVASIGAARERLGRETADLVMQREAALLRAQQGAIPPDRRDRITELAAARAKALALFEDAEKRRQAVGERLADISRYRAELGDEIERMIRAADAGAALADLKITHCPACDQAVDALGYHGPDCFLCHQALPPGPVIEELGAVRLRFERDRLDGELKEAQELETVLRADFAKHDKTAFSAEAAIRAIDQELVPARQAVAILAQTEVSALDRSLGQATERSRQLDRVSAALELGTSLTAKIAELEKEIVPIEARVAEAARRVDFEAAAARLEDGMNAYLGALNAARPDVWRHSRVNIDLTRSGITMRVGGRRWGAVLGGTDSLYFLMAYHYGLLTLSPLSGTHYPGLSIIDVPGEFSGEAVEDKENFIVQPFIDLLATPAFEGCQVIMTGASFAGLIGAHFQSLRHVYVA